MLGGWYWVVSGGEARGQSWRGRIILDGGGGGWKGGESVGEKLGGRVGGGEKEGWKWREGS